MKNRVICSAFLAVFIIMGKCGTGHVDQRKVVRFGHFPNITHAQGVIANGLSREGKGFFEKALGPDYRIEWYIYNAGPTAMEALLAGTLDLTYVGPNPAINAHIKSKGEEIRIVAGAASGGAAFVVQPDGRIMTDTDLRGKKIATPQLGNTQDVAARAYLISKGYKVSETGGDVFVIPTRNPDQLALFLKKELDGVWTVEPWVSSLIKEGNAQVYLEERDLWPNGQYVTTHLVSSVKFLKEKPDLLKKLIAAHVELTEWINAHMEEATLILNKEIKEETGKALPEEIIKGSFTRLEITYDPIASSLLKSADSAFEAGFLGEERPDLSRIYDLSLLNEALQKKGFPAIEK